MKFFIIIFTDRSNEKKIFWIEQLNKIIDIIDDIIFLLFFVLSK